MTASIWLTVAVIGIGTYLFRAGFILFAHRIREIPPVVSTALRMIPAAALSALCAPIILSPGGVFTPFSARTGAALVALGVAWKTSNIGLTILAGLVVVLVFSFV